MCASFCWDRLSLRPLPPFSSKGEDEGGMMKPCRFSMSGSRLEPDRTREMKWSPAETEINFLLSPSYLSHWQLRGELKRVVHRWGRLALPPLVPVYDGSQGSRETLNKNVLNEAFALAWSLYPVNLWLNLFHDFDKFFFTAFLYRAA